MSDSAQTKEILRNSIGAHGIWKMRLKVALSNGGKDFSADTVRCDDQCDFGKWLHDPQMPAALRRTAHYDRVSSLHAKFHTAAAEVLTKLQAGQAQEAAQCLEGDFAANSAALTRSITEWSKSL